LSNGATIAHSKYIFFSILKNLDYTPHIRTLLSTLNRDFYVLASCKDEEAFNMLTKLPRVISIKNSKELEIFEKHNLNDYSLGIEATPDFIVKVFKTLK
jgi:hypothetical protein